MSENFFSISSSAHHYAHPFSCPAIEQKNEVQEIDYSLSTIQKAIVIATAILVGAVTFGVGIVPTFYILAALLKSRNVVWVEYTQVCSDAYSGPWYWTTSDWWGIHLNHGTRVRYDGIGDTRRGSQWTTPKKRPENQERPGWRLPAKQYPYPDPGRPIEVDLYREGRGDPARDPYRGERLPLGGGQPARDSYRGERLPLGGGQPATGTGGTRGGRPPVNRQLFK